MPSKTEYDKALLDAHALHDGLYRRVADQLGVHPSYVSRVATGKRKEPDQVPEAVQKRFDNGFVAWCFANNRDPDYKVPICQQ